MQNWRPWDVVSKADWGLAVEREAVIRPLAEEAKLSADHVHEAMLRLTLRRSALYKAGNASRDCRSLRVEAFGPERC